MDLAGKRVAVVGTGASAIQFVPRIADFERLDPRFRLPETVWRALPQYADWIQAKERIGPNVEGMYALLKKEPLLLPTRSVGRGTTEGGGGVI